jgi:hypothetical protein
VAQAPLHDRRRLRLHAGGAGREGQHLCGVVGVHEGAERDAHEGAVAIAERVVGRRARPRDEAVVHDHNDVAAVLHERAEARLAGGDGALGGAGALLGALAAAVAQDEADDGADGDQGDHDHRDVGRQRGVARAAVELGARAAEHVLQVHEDRIGLLVVHAGGRGKVAGQHEVQLALDAPVVPREPLPHGGDHLAEFGLAGLGGHEGREERVGAPEREARITERLRGRTRRAMVALAALTLGQDLGHGAPLVAAGAEGLRLDAAQGAAGRHAVQGAHLEGDAERDRHGGDRHGCSHHPEHAPVAPSRHVAVGRVVERGIRDAHRERTAQDRGHQGIGH